MERLDAYIGSLDSTLQETPVIFEAVGVDVLDRVDFGMVNDVMDIFGIQSGVGNPMRQ